MVFMKQIKDGKLIITVGSDSTIKLTEYNSLQYLDTDIYSDSISCPTIEELNKWHEVDYIESIKEGE